MRRLETERMRLEPLRAVHAKSMFDGLADSRLYEFIEEEPPKSRKALRERYARLESRRSPSGDEVWLNWLVLTKPALAARGYVQATVAGTTATVAYVLFVDAWGRGLASEAVEKMLGELRDTYAVRRARATVDPRNARSVHLLERLGFERARTHDGEAEYVRALSRARVTRG